MFYLSNFLLGDILKNRKQKTLKLSNGVNKIVENKKIIYPEEQKALILKRRNQKEQNVLLVQERGIEYFRSSLEKKTIGLKRHENRQNLKNFEQYFFMQTSLYVIVRRIWPIFILLTKLVCFLHEKNIKNRALRYKNAYLRQLRAVAILSALKVIRKRGKSPKTRVLFESKLLILHSFSFIKKRKKDQAKNIFKNIIKQAGIMIFIRKKMENYANNVIKIQKKWKLLKTRKLMYKATIRNIWNKNAMNFYLILKKEKQGKKEEMQGINEGLLFNNMLIGNIRSRRNENPALMTISNVDP